MTSAPAAPAPVVALPEVKASDRTDRFAKAFKLDALLPVPTTIVGVGAVGATIARELATIGFHMLTLVDPDVVEPANLGLQQWWPSQIGQKKVNALTEQIRHINPKTECIPLDAKFQDILEQEDFDLNEPLFCCVDNMEARRELFKLWLTTDSPIFIDPRMGLTTGRLFVVRKGDKKAILHYEKEWFPQKDAHAAPCGEVATRPCGGIVSLAAVHAFMACQGSDNHAGIRTDTAFQLAEMDMYDGSK